MSKFILDVEQDTKEAIVKMAKKLKISCKAVCMCGLKKMDVYLDPKDRKGTE